jgi:putative membrane protein
MRTIAYGLTALVALLHAGFMALEMLWWTKPAGRRVFGTTAEFAQASRVLAANQGLYNGFLAAGLAWGLWLGDEGRAIRLFFLVCVVVAGVFGAATASRRILWVQALPAAVAILFTLLA